MLLTADTVLTGEARDGGVLRPGWVDVADGRVVAVGSGAPPRPADLALGAVTVAPGFVDTHVHGGGGASFTGAPEDSATVLAAHRSRGTTTMVASLVADAQPSLVRSVRGLAAQVEEGLLAGIHLEGPWLSARRAGAHEVRHLREPVAAEVEELLDAGRGTIRMVTLAPELPGALDATRRLVAAGVTVAVGHTEATYDQTRAALDAGARVGTHLFNAMRGLHHREPGPVPALLEHPDTVVELVADGVHAHPAVLALAAHAAAGRVTLISDAMAAAAADDGDYRLGALAVEVRDGVARLASSGAIAGSTLTLDDAVRFAVRRCGLSLDDAVRAATSTPAGALGLDGVGVLRAGAAADLVVLDDDLSVERVMQRGVFVSRPAPLTVVSTPASA